jgi:hypothetical protein
VGMFSRKEGRKKTLKNEDLEETYGNIGENKKEAKYRIEKRFRKKHKEET